ncbi:response regulator [Nostoc sp.]|uniref:response regulator n=1 Tax=Nostoc sp. TaxID=1180 RepID=UPI002FF9EADA
MHGQKEAFQAAVNGAPLADSLDILARLVAEETVGEARTAFYIANAEGSSLHPVYGAGSMPDAYLDRVDGFAIGKDSLACGLAIPTGRPVLTHDVAQEPLWQPWVQMAEAYDYRGCWSFPIVTRDDRKGIGTLAMYFRQPREATPGDLALAEIVTQSAAVIINSHFEAQERARAEAALRESEEKYLSLFESINDGFALVEVLYDDDDRPIDCRFLEVSPSFENQTGLRQTQGKTLRELIPSIEPGWSEQYHQALVTNALVHFEMWQDYLKTWFEVDVLPYCNPYDRRVTIIFRNINDRKRTEAQLRRAAEMDAFRVKLSDALRSLSDPEEITYQAVCVLGKHLGTDRAYYVEIDEARSEFVVARDWHQPGAPSHARRYPLSEWPMPWLVDGQPWVVRDVDTDPAMPNDQRASYRENDIGALIVVPLIKNGRLVATLATNQHTPRDWTPDEITFVQETAERTWAAVERAYAEAALRESELQRVREQSARKQERQRAESLAELDRAKTLFFSNVSHEFRTPLTLLLAPLQDALIDSANPLTQKQRELLKLAHCNSLRLLKLVNTLLDFSRIEADGLNANYEPTDLSTYTAELASVFRSAIENANLQLVVNCPPLPDPIYVDRQMWEKIVLNLLSNALKFTFEGIISVSLKPVKEAREQGSRGAGEQGSNSSPLPLRTSAPLPLLDAPCLFVELTVSDTGVGISASELPHLFERFYQVKGAKGRSYEGSGIGLSLVQELVKRHGGAIAVTSAVDQGTIFTVTIPTGIAHLPADQIWVASTLASSAVTANAFVEEALHWLPEESTEFQNSEVQVQNSEVHAQNSEVQAQNSEVQAQSSEVHAQSSEVHAQNSEVHAQNSEVQVQSLELQVQGSEVQVQNSEVQAQSSKRARILLVDDNADMRGYLKRLLNQYYEVETVNDGLAALTAIRRGGSAIYDLVLTDVMMPRMDGFELLRSLRASLNTQTIPIILLSACAGEESRVEGLETGADDYLIKPFSARELLARVNANLQLAQLRREAVYREQVMQAVQTLNERLEQQVNARTAQLEAINQELEAFSSSISHDLQTPLRYIRSFAEQLQAKLNATLVDASSLQILNIITKSALEAEKMVDDLLEFSRLGQTKISLTTVNYQSIGTAGARTIAA